MFRVIVYKNAQDTIGQVLHEPKSFGNKVLAGDVALLFNGISTATFTIPMDNSLYRRSEAIANLIKVVDTKTGKIVFDGRIVKIDGSFNNTHTQLIQAEDCLAYLHDSTQIYRKVQNTSIRDFLQMIIATHNDQVESWKKFQLGRVTVTNSTDNVYRYTDDAADTFNTIKDKLISRLGGFLIWHRDTNQQLILEYLAEVGDHVDTPIQLGKNLKSAKREYDLREVITRLVPLGATIQPEGENDEPADAAYPNITIESVNDGRRYLEDDQLKSTFGIIQKAVNWSDVHDANQLKSKGLSYLNRQRVGLLTWTVDVVDVSLLDNNFKTFEIGNYYPIYDEFLGIVEELQVVEKHLNITEPHQLTLKIGSQNRTLSQHQIDSFSAMTFAEEQRKNAMYTIARLKKQLDGLSSQPEEFYTGNIIDVSEWQGQIDWKALQNEGLALAIIRIQHGTTHEDLTYKDNLAEVINLGVNYAVYSYMTAGNEAEAVAEADKFYRLTQAQVSGKTQPRFYMIDVETMTSNDMRGTVEAYMNHLNELSVPDNQIVLYIANHLYSQFNLNVNRAGSVMVPAYRSTPPDHAYDLWQYTSKGRITGIGGNVDMSKDYSVRFKQQYLRKGAG